MTRIDELAPDQRAVLSLILRRGRSYAQIATALQIDEDVVREHAYGALDEIAGEAGDGLSADEREQIADYLLAQQTPTERLVTYDELEGSHEARAFASAVIDELATMAGGTLPEIPDDAGTGVPARNSARPSRRSRPPRAARARRAAAPPKPRPQAETVATVDSDELADRPSAPPSRPRRAPAKPSAGERAAAMASRPSSRIGGAILLGLIVLGVVLGVVLTGGSGGSSPAAKSGTPASGAAARGTTGANASASGNQVRLSKQIRLTPPAGGNAVGAAAVLTEGTSYVVALAAEHLAPTQGFFYAAWLYNSPSQAYALGKAPSVGANGVLKPVAQALPPTASQYHQLLITKETSERPSQPGETVLSGPFSLR
jgi:hypothetical protein